MPAPLIHSRRPSRITPLVMFLAGLALFVAIAADVTHHGKLQQADQAIAPYIHEHSVPVLVAYAAGFSALGEFWLLLPLGVVVGLFLIWKRSWRCLAVWATGLIGSMLICGTLKDYFAIDRPSRFTFFTFKEGVGHTFPSGHTMGATIASGLLALLWMRWRARAPRGRVAAAVAAAVLGSLVAASLLYIGVHYLTDVLGGLSISLAWLGVLRFALPPAYDAALTATGDSADAARSIPPEHAGAQQVDRGADTPAL